MSEPTKFETWGILEIMGHAVFAGRLSSECIGGVDFIRVDVPELPAESDYYTARPAFTKYFTQAAIFSMTPTTEEAAREAARCYRSVAANVYSPPRLTSSDPDDGEEY